MRKAYYECIFIPRVLSAWDFILVFVMIMDEGGEIMAAGMANKAIIIEEIKDKLSRAKGVVLVDYSGINVQEVTELRAQFRKANVEYKVYKNTLVLRAANELGIEDLEQYLHGTTAFAFDYENPVAPAKVLTEYIGKIKKMQIKSGILESRVVSAAGVEDLSKLPSKEILVAQLLGVMNAPVRDFASVLNGTARSLVQVLSAIQEKISA